MLCTPAILDRTGNQYTGMDNKIIVRQLLGELVDTAKGQGGSITVQAVNDRLCAAGLDARQLRLIYEYLTDQGVRVQGFTDQRERGAHRLWEETAGEGPASEETGGLCGREKDRMREETGEQEDAGGQRQAGEQEDAVEELPALAQYLAQLDQIGQADTLIALDLFHAAADGQEQAREALLRSMLSMVCDLAGELEEPGVAVEDLIQEGNMELWLAMKELERQESLAAYQAGLMNRVSGAMYEARERQRSEREADRKMVNKVRYLDQAISSLKEELGRRPTAEELSAFLEIPAEEIRDILKLAAGG